MIAFLAGCGQHPPESRWWIGGDVHLGQPRPFLDPALAHELGGVGFVNLEGPIGTAQTSIGPDGKVTLVHDVGVLGSLRDAGVRVVGVANNHAGDAGPDGLGSTVAAVRASGLTPAPGRLGSIDVVQVDLKGPIPDLAQRLVGAEVVAFHVTAPPDPVPTELLRQAVDVAVAAGAKVVVAEGTHAFGPVERRGDTVIAWGLGNLAFDCPCTRIEDGLVLEVSPTDPAQARIVPITAGLDGQPAILSDHAEEVLDVVSALSTTELRREPLGASF